MAHERPERDNHAGLAIVAALQSDPSGRTVHTGSNPLVPLLNGSFDMLRAARAADAAFKQWDAAYATEAAAVVAATAPAPVVLSAHERRETVLASLKLVDDEIIESAILEAEKQKDAAPAAAPDAPDAPPLVTPAGEGDATGLV